MSNGPHPVIRSGLLLGLIALLGTGLLAGVNELTHERIIEQDRLRVLRQLNEIVPVGSYNNDLLADTTAIEDAAFFHHSDPVLAYRARMDGKAVAVLMIVTAPNGYNGDIRMIVGIDAGGTVLGVRVVAHRETPGLGDPIETGKSDWILGFNGKSLHNPGNTGWAVRRDGGEFDQFTGATITPRAIVGAVHSALLYFAANRQSLFSAGTQQEPAR